MKKQTWISGILLVVFCLLFVKVQSIIIEERKGRRVEEKILMLSDRPEITKMLALGNDSTLADILWIRAIQYFGGNFSTLNRPEKKPGMVNLFRNMVALDPHFPAAYQFGGFVMNESMKDSNLAISFLLEGADRNPDFWRLRFDAGFIAFTQLNDYDIAKRLFVQTPFGENLALNAKVKTEGIVEGFEEKALHDDDVQSDVKFKPEGGSISIELPAENKIGRINVVQNTAAQQSFRLSKSDAADSTASQEITGVTQAGVYEIISPFPARSFTIDDMATESEDGFFAVSEIQIHGPRNPNVPTYVDRMAIEMDRAAGRFRITWDQYRRYYDEAIQKGDQISAELTAQKLDDIYFKMVSEILDEAIRTYLEKEGKLPSPSMRELIEGNYIQQVLQQRMLEDDQFRTDILPVLLGANGNVYNMLITWDGRSPILMLPVPGAEEKQDWRLITRLALLSQQKTKLESLQKLVDQYKEESTDGKLPETLEALKTGRLFTGSDDLFTDPLGGEFFINPENGKVEASNPKY